MSFEEWEVKFFLEYFDVHTLLDFRCEMAWLGALGYNKSDESWESYWASIAYWDWLMDDRQSYLRRVADNKITPKAAWDAALEWKRKKMEENLSP